MGGENNYGDWLNADTLILENWPKQGGNTPADVFATAFFAHSTELLSKMAAILGRDSEATGYWRLAKDIKASFCEHFLQPMTASPVRHKPPTRSRSILTCFQKRRANPP